MEFIETPVFTKLITELLPDDETFEFLPKPGTLSFP